MDRETLRKLLAEFKAGDVSEEGLLDRLAALPFRELGHTTLDTHRGLRAGFPEVLYGLGKTAEQILDAAVALFESGSNVLITKISAEKAESLGTRFGPSGVLYDPLAKAALVRRHAVEEVGVGSIAVVAAGTSDLPVAKEAVFCARAMGQRVEEITDVGVAGIHRLFHHQEKLRAANVLIVAAGMEGALPSVVGGLVSRPIIAVPTSVGYGASFGGLAALLAMLNACSPGITVVNIDNGFGAAYAASLINRRPNP
jgi:NCAIR mutase (PurE)-related protein